MRPTYYAILIAFTFFSCGQTSEDHAHETQKTFSTIVAPGIIALPDVSEEAQEQLARWQTMKDFIREVKQLNGSSYTELRNHSENMMHYADSLTRNIPETFNNQPVKSRLLVIKTRTEMLDQWAHTDAVDSLKIHDAVQEMNLAVSNFIVQINEKLLKDRIHSERRADEETELRKQRKTQDSIYALEAEDLKKRQNQTNIP